MKIYVNEKHEIKAINSATDEALKEIEVDREVVFGNMSDFMILNYCYAENEIGYAMYPSRNYKDILEEDYRNKVDNAQTKIFNLEEGQKQQDEEILINMMANTEMFEMILSMMPLSINTKKLGGNPMIEVYCTLILKGVKKIEDVPSVLRDQVVERLKQLEVPVK